MREIGRRESNWAGARAKKKMRGTICSYNNVSPLAFDSQSQKLTSSGHGDEAGKNEEDESEAHGGSEIGGWGVESGKA